jgi:hypothetical protein
LAISVVRGCYLWNEEFVLIGAQKHLRERIVVLPDVLIELWDLLGRYSARSEAHKSVKIVSLAIQIEFSTLSAGNFGLKLAFEG